MTGARSYDAIVVGAGVNGLAAASYLARARKRVLVVEARPVIGGLCETARFGDGVAFSQAAHTLYALDPRVIRELKLARHGLKFAIRDMALVGLRADGKHIVLSRDDYASARNIALQSDADAAMWRQFKREWYRLGRKMRVLWWDAGRKVPDNPLRDGDVRHLAHTGTAAWLDSWFESDALKATLGFDAHALSPLAAGSALLLLWRAAQEMCGLQGAVAIPCGGLHAVSDALAASARRVGVEIQTGACVADILVNTNDAARGVTLASGEVIAAPLVLSSLSRRQTLRYPSPCAALGLAQAADLHRVQPGIASARVTFMLDEQPRIGGVAVPATARFIVAERLDVLAAAHAAACAGRLPQDLTMEVVMPSAADPTPVQAGRHVVSVLVSPVPAAVEGGWQSLKAVLAAKVVSALGRHFAGMAHHLAAVEVLTPEDVREIFGADDCVGGAVSAERMLAGWRARVRTPIPGLILCGSDADPVGAVSGRGGRVAAAYSFAEGVRE